MGPDKGEDSAPVRNIVRRLRRKLDDDPGSPGYIFAEPTVGYRMEMGDAQETGSDPIPDPEPELEPEPEPEPESSD